MKYHSVTKSDSDCIIKSECKIRHSTGTSSSDEASITIKEKPLGSLLVWRKPSGQWINYFDNRELASNEYLRSRFMFGIAERDLPQMMFTEVGCDRIEQL